jgi:hypothetical protein
MSIKPLILLLLITTQIKAQPPVLLSMDRSSNGTYSIIAENKTFSTYTVRLNLSGVIGYDASVSSETLIPVNPGRSEIAKLKPSSTMPGNTSLRYSYTSYKGEPLRKTPDTTFTYLLPSTEKQIITGVQVNSLSQTLKMESEGNFFAGNAPPRDFSSVGFLYKKGDTITACRAGTITEATGDKAGDKQQQIFTVDRNKIVVEHKDGTYANYSLLSSVQLLVQPGDKVIPGQPLAIFVADEGKYTVLLHVNYLDEKKARSGTVGEGKTVSPYANVPMMFFTGEKNESILSGKKYQAVYAKEIILKELDKRQKKSLNF